MITQKELKELFHYDPDTGVFTRLKCAGSFNVGAVVGSKTSHGYMETSIKGKRYYLHRLAWVYMYDEIPDVIDHINHKRSDNRISNLRNTSVRDNNKNLTKRKTNSSGFTGVHWSSSRKKWVAQIQIAGKMTPLGRHETLIDAVIVRIKANQFYMFSENHGR